MIVSFTPHGWEDYLYWQQTDDKIVEKINDLVKDISRDPFRGIGKPEPLRGPLSGYWSRRISGEHRLIYGVSGSRPNQTITVIGARFHYNKNS
jgi:toxin YoeB